ncbi:MAG TPA: ABC transporter permease [Chloroflexi bacterium]|nr:ABC transporter permease [Chloroflexota bacterium]
MLSYAVRKLLTLIPVMLGVYTLVFVVMQVLPGDPAQIRAGPGASAEAIENIRRQMGLDKPIPIQYVDYLQRAVRLDFGRSFRTNQPVIDELKTRYVNTIQLTVAATAIFITVGLPLGVIAAVKRNSIWDGLAILVSLLGISMPGFWLGLLLIWYFSVKLGWFPTFGFSSPKHVILPALTLASYGIAYTARYTRSSMLEELMQDYVITARAKGLRERVVLYRHALRNALIPVVTQAALGFGLMLGGAVVVEVVFTVNGVGKLIVDGILSRDYPVVQAGVLLLALNFVLVNLLADLAYGYIDPRVRLQ